MCATLAVRTHPPLFASCRALYHQHHREGSIIPHQHDLLKVVLSRFRLLPGGFMISKTGTKTHDGRLRDVRVRRVGKRIITDTRSSAFVASLASLFISFSCHRLLFK